MSSRVSVAQSPSGRAENFDGPTSSAMSSEWAVREDPAGEEGVPLAGAGRTDGTIMFHAAAPSAAQSPPGDGPSGGGTAHGSGHGPEQITDAGPVPFAMVSSAIHDPKKRYRVNGPELINSAGPPLPPSIATTDADGGLGKENAEGPPRLAGLEQVDGAELPASGCIDEGISEKDAHEKKLRVELIDDDDAPSSPFEAGGEEDFADKEKKTTLELPSAAHPVARMEEVVSDEMGGRIDRDAEMTGVQPMERPAEHHVVLNCEQPPTTPRTPNETGYQDDLNDDESESLPNIPVAYCVDDAMVYAEPMRPWCKQTRTKVLFSAVCVLVIGIAVAVGVRPTPSDNAVTTVVTEATMAPSTSAVPSAAPSTCAFKVALNVETLDLRHKDPYLPRVVVDGANAMTVFHDQEANSAFNVVFHDLESGSWQFTNAFIDETFSQYFTGGTYSSDISGRTALMGLWKSSTHAGSKAGVVRVYRQDELGLWERAEDLHPNDGGQEGIWFGRSVGIDGDFACVAAALESAVYVFQQDEKNDRWVQIERLDFGFTPVWDCLITGTTLVVQAWDISTDNFEDVMIYDYDQEMKRFMLTQSLPANGLGLELAISEDYFVHSVESFSASNGETVYEGMNIYQRGDGHGPFTLRQVLNSTDYDSMFGAHLAIDGDILVVYALNTTVIFSESEQDSNDDIWEEALVQERPYMSYQVSVSGRSILAMGFQYPVVVEEDEDFVSSFENEVWSLNIEDCTQTLPTAFPSASQAPLVAVSYKPCTVVVVEVNFDYDPGDVSWHFVPLSDSSVVESYQGAWSDLKRLKSWQVCLKEGSYRFIIRDNEGDVLVEMSSFVLRGKLTRAFISPR